MRDALARLADQLGIKDSPIRALAIALLAAALVGGTVVFAVDVDGDGTPDHTTTVQLPKLYVIDPVDPGPAISAPAKQVEQVADQVAAEHGSLDHSHGEGDPLPDAVYDANQRVAQAQTEGIAPPLERASFRQRGCRTLPLDRNFSSRGGARPSMLGNAHITVSGERPGWGDVLGIREFFNTAGVGASSHYVIDGEAHCAYIVAETAKAWTSGNMNPWAACQIEMIGIPGDNGWKRSPGLAKAALVLGDCAERWGIPVRLGNTAGCNVLKAGLVDHNELECNNDHWDICDPGDAAIGRSENCALTRRIVPAIRDQRRTLTAKELKWVRSARRPVGTGHSRRFWCDQIRRRIRTLEQPATGRDRAARRRILRRVARATCT